MVKNFVSLNIYGNKFDLQNLEKYEKEFLAIERKTDIETKGRFKGKPKKYNGISIEVPDNIISFSDRIYWVLDKFEILRDEIDYQKKNQKDDLLIIFMIIIYWNSQCNYSFEPELIRRFHLFKETINITCCELDDNEFSKIPGSNP